MKKKIIALMMVIPLVLMLTIFTISKTVSITVDVPAESIEITSQNTDGFLSFDMATYQGDYKVEATVYPQEAKNKKYNIEVKNLDDVDSPCISLTEDNYLVLNRVGLAEITVKSNDKGFTDTLKVAVDSSKPYDMSVTLVDKDVVNLIESNIPGIDYEYHSTTGGTIQFNSSIEPSSIIDRDTTWDVDNEGLLLNRFNGISSKIFSGEYIVTATVKDGIKGDIKKKIKVVLDKPQGVTVNGKENARVMINENSSQAIFYVETDDDLFDVDITCLDANEIIVDEIANKTHCYKVTINLNRAFKLGESTKIEIFNNGKHSEFNVDATKCLRNVTTKYDKGNGIREFKQKNNSSLRYTASIEPHSLATYTWSTNSSLIEINPIGNSTSADIKANGVGKADFTIQVKIGDEIFTDTYTIDLVETISNPSFDLKTNYGIKKIYTFADTKLEDGNYVKVDNIIDVISSNGNKALKEILEFKSLDEKIVKIDNNGKIEILNDGVAEIVATYKYNEYFNENITSKTKIAVSKDAVYVGDSDTLLKATDDGKKIVLKNNIEFAKDYSVEKIVGILNNHIMPTTFDWHYYLNTGKNGNVRPNVKYILEFKNDVYGNGYTINTESITNAKDGNNPRYFKGPLNFVAVEEMAAVKGQDNISFLVRNKGVKLDNVCLESIKDSSLLDTSSGESKLELNKLNFVGTTLEIMGDDVELINSRVKNGRTVVRIYSGNDDTSVTSEFELNPAQIAKERINVLIESSVLSHAREFVLKIGSNRGVICKPNKDGYKQYMFKDENGVPFDYLKDIVDKTYKKESKVNDILLTDVTLKDSILDTSGLFAVGMESHFSGPFLTGEDDKFGATLKKYGWWNLAATSYGAVLRLVGDVRIYDWKNVKNVDSSTLIESNGKGGETLSKIISLDIGKMIEMVGNKAEYKDILSNVNGESFVHGGIAFYGGGYNYSKLDLDNFAGEKYNTYNINIGILKDNSGSDEDLQGQMLPLAAGTEDFTFYMYNKNSKFNYDKQIQELNDGSAYGWIKGVLK